MPAPTILYAIEWYPYRGAEKRMAYAMQPAAHELVAALRGSGVTDIECAPARGQSGRHAAIEAPVDEPLTGAAADRIRDQLRRGE